MFSSEPVPRSGQDRDNTDIEMTDRFTEERREQSRWSVYRTELLAFARQRLHDAAAAEDIVQEVLAKGYARQEQLNDSSRLRAWLYQSTRNALIDYYRRAKPVEGLPDDRADPEESNSTGIAEGLVHCLRSLIQDLPITYREALILSELQGMRQKEVAAMLGITHSGAKSRVQRGRSLLRERMTDCCDISQDVRGGVMDHQCRKQCGCC